MALFPERIPQPNNVGAEWLAVVRGDARMTGEIAALNVAEELARHVRDCGSGELPSVVDLARAVRLSEDAAIGEVNSLIVRGYVTLTYRPRISFAVQFFVRPGPYQAAMIGKRKSTGKGAGA